MHTDVLQDNHLPVDLRKPYNLELGMQFSGRGDNSIAGRTRLLFLCWSSSQPSNDGVLPVLRA